MNQILGHAVSLAVAAACGLATPPAAADDAGPDLRGGAWWQWALSIPAPASPLVDASGANCMVGQRGNHWFLAGTFFGGTASRVCQVPQGVRLVFPLANSVQFDTPGVCGQGASISVADLRAAAAQTIDGVKAFGATLDSRPVQAVRRVRSAVFPLSLPADNVFNLPTVCGAGGVPAGVYARSVDDGYYAEVDGLAVGEHILQIAATFADNSSVDVTYRLIVVPRDRR